MWSKLSGKGALRLSLPLQVDQLAGKAGERWQACGSTSTVDPGCSMKNWPRFRAYRRAKGLCQRCAEKWSRDLQCPTVQLHAL